MRDASFLERATATAHHVTLSKWATKPGAKHEAQLGSSKRIRMSQFHMIRVMTLIVTCPRSVATDSGGRSKICSRTPKLVHSLGEHIHELTAQEQLDELVRILVHYEAFRRILVN